MRTAQRLKKGYPLSKSFRLLGIIGGRTVLEPILRLPRVPVYCIRDQADICLVTSTPLVRCCDRDGPDATDFYHLEVLVAGTETGRAREGPGRDQ
jgi:hypothetical protein